jgi:hypothetical protein
VRLEWKVIMNDVEDLLREGMERFTRDLRAPAGLTQRVAQRRRRRLAWRSAVGVVAAACAASVVAVVLPTASDGGESVALAASVVKRVDNALSTSDIAQMTITTRGPLASSCSGGECRVVPGKTATTTAEEWSYGDQWRSVTYLDGRPVYDEGTNSSSVYTFVSYQERTWARARQPGFGGVSVQLPVAHGCGPFASAGARLFQPGLPGIDFSASSPPATMAAALRAAVSCGTLAETGRQRVDGIDAIKLISRPGSMISETIWVSPGTYLPVRVVVDWGFRAVTANVTWLQPTTENLAKISVQIPAGFRHVSLAEALGQTMLQVQGGPRINGLCLVSSFGPACIPAPGSSFGYGPRPGRQ